MFLAFKKKEKLDRSTDEEPIVVPTYESLVKKAFEERKKHTFMEKCAMTLIYPVANVLNLAD